MEVQITITQDMIEQSGGTLNLRIDTHGLVRRQGELPAVVRRPTIESLVERINVKRIPDSDLWRYFAVINDRIFDLHRMVDITHQKTVNVDGYIYKPRNIAFYLIHHKWPGRNFKLPWE